MQVNKKKLRSRRLTEVIYMRGFTKYKFAKDTNYNLSSVKDWCKGRSEGFMRELDVICMFLGIDCGYIVGDDGFVSSDYNSYIKEKREEE